LVNDVAEMLGVADDEDEEVDEVAELLALEALLLLLLELPHPAATAETARANAHTRNLRVLILHAPLTDAQM
jgi:hypothetical protein